jgi:hypothetical protein
MARLYLSACSDRWDENILASLKEGVPVWAQKVQFKRSSRKAQDFQWFLRLHAHISPWQEMSQIYNGQTAELELVAAIKFFLALCRHGETDSERLRRGFQAVESAHQRRAESSYTKHRLKQYSPTHLLRQGLNKALRHGHFLTGVHIVEWNLFTPEEVDALRDDMRRWGRNFSWMWTCLSLRENWALNDSDIHHCLCSSQLETLEKFPPIREVRHSHYLNYVHKAGYYPRASLHWFAQNSFEWFEPRDLANICSYDVALGLDLYLKYPRHAQYDLDWATLVRTGIQMRCFPIVLKCLQECPSLWMHPNLRWHQDSDLALALIQRGVDLDAISDAVPTYWWDELQFRRKHLEEFGLPRVLAKLVLLFV